MLNEAEIRIIVRRELQGVISEKRDEFQELKYMLAPTRLKGEIRRIIGEMLKSFEDHMREDILGRIDWEKQINRIDKVIEESMQRHLLHNEKNIKKYIRKAVRDGITEDLDKIIINSLNLSDNIIRKQICKRLHDVVMLKTSTIMEVQTAVMKEPADYEEEVIRKLEKEFPKLIE